MYSIMSKQKSKGEGTPEVHSARSKLDGLLQTLVEKKEDSSFRNGSGDEALGTESGRGDSVTTTPTKRPLGGRPSRKRRRGKEDTMGPEMGQYHHTYVMKLFDRSVDLAQFDEDTPLYPICRAWMRNQPHNRNLAPREGSPSPHPQEDEEDEAQRTANNVYQLPAPTPIKLEFGADLQDLRVPSPVPQPKEEFDLYTDPASAPPPEQLLLNHMARWKLIRQKWKDCARRNEVRYGDGMRLLRDMFDRQCKDQ